MSPPEGSETGEILGCLPILRMLRFLIWPKEDWTVVSLVQTSRDVTAPSVVISSWPSRQQLGCWPIVNRGCCVSRHYKKKKHKMHD